MAAHKHQENQWCPRCQQFRTAAKTTHGVQNSAAVAAGIFTAGLSLLAARVEPLICPLCGTKTDLLAPRDVRQQVKHALATGDNATLHRLGYVPRSLEGRWQATVRQAVTGRPQTATPEYETEALPTVSTCWAPGCGEPVADGEIHYCGKHAGKRRADLDGDRDLTMKPFDPFSPTSPTDSESDAPAGSPASTDALEASLSAERGEASDIFDQIRKLGELCDAGLVTAEEFDAKKAELLDRL